MKGHLIKVHKIEKKETQCVQCQFCDQGFKRLRALNAHVSVLHPEVRNEEGLIYLNKTLNEQINDFQVTNGPINGMYQWTRRVVERTLAAQSMEGEDLMEHEMLHLNKKKIIKPKMKMSFEYEVELSDSEKCEYIDASVSVCI